MQEHAEPQIYVFGTKDGRRFITTAKSANLALARIMERFPRNRSHDAPIDGEQLFPIASSMLDGVIEERLTTHITVM